MDAEVGEIANFLPIEPAAGVEREAAVAAVVPAVGRGRGESLQGGPTQAVGVAGHEAARRYHENSRSSFHGQRPDFDAIVGWRMRDDRSDAYGAVAFIDCDGFDGGIGMTTFSVRQASRRAASDRSV
jgi:hypothetical protein